MKYSQSNIQDRRISYLLRKVSKHNAAYLIFFHKTSVGVAYSEPLITRNPNRSIFSVTNRS